MIALVTGGLDRIGAAIAVALAERGFVLALHCRHQAPPAPALAAVLGRPGQRHCVLEADLADEAAVRGLVPAASAALGGPVTCLVNSASTIAEGGWAEVGAAELIAFHRINVVAPVLLVQALAAGLDTDGAGVAINIVDQRIANPPVDQAAYTASKLALGALTPVLARAFAPRVRVNAVGPGLTIPGDDYRPGQAERIVGLMPLERLPAPADIAAAVAYLATAPAVTGQTLLVDGGAALESFRRDFVHLGRDA